ncbi:MAG: hypothetical protein R2712_21765 [Vicinamibacterales bacterium]
MAQMIANAVSQAGTNFVETIRLFLPRVLTTIAIVLVGWLIAVVLKTVVRWVLGWLRVNAGAERIGLAQMLRTADLPPADILTSRIVFWLVWIGFLLSGVDVLGFVVLQGMVASFILFVPRLLVALGIIVAGLITANFLARHAAHGRQFADALGRGCWPARGAGAGARARRRDGAGPPR